MQHVVLLGDSILDNKRYVGDSNSVTEHLQYFTSVYGKSNRVTCRAVDGSVIDSVKFHLAGSPNNATYYVVSTGGNDGLRFLAHGLNLLKRPWKLVKETYQFLQDFEVAYRDMLKNVLLMEKPVTVCTIYRTNYPWYANFITKAGVMIINRIIRRVAGELHVDVLDLWDLIDPTKDLANPIEPGVKGKYISLWSKRVGGKKIALEIVSRAFIQDESS